MGDCYGCGWQRTSILDGLDLSYLQSQLVAMQQAYIQLMSGAKVAMASYAQADGSRSVTYTQVDKEGLVQAILDVQTQIDNLTGVCNNRRAPLIPNF
jgi:hypothetical protein